MLGPQITRVQGACARAGVGAVLGVNERLAGTRTCFNSQVFIDPDGTLLRVHRKLQPCPARKYDSVLACNFSAQGGGLRGTWVICRCRFQSSPRWSGT